jgi:uncharacterized protein (DUF1800 family)
MIGLTAWACGAQSPRTASAPKTADNQTTAVASSRELLPDEQVQQVLNRLTFGARPGDAESVRAIGVDAWIQRQLHPDRIEDPAMEALMAHYPIFTTSTRDIIRNSNLAQRLRAEMRKLAAADSATDPTQARRDTLRNDPKIAQLVRENRQLVGQIQSAQVARAVATERQLDEVMVEFWENHFSVYFGKGLTRVFLADFDHNVIRPNALGRFRDLLGAVAKSPAMLGFLDNFQSAADSTAPILSRMGRRRPTSPRLGAIGQRVLAGATPEQRQKLQQRATRGLNENYARELMELHTLGVDGGYTQKDVQEVARALTGWSFVRASGQFVFNPNVHDAGEKIILGEKFPAGHGLDEGERVLDIVARHPSTARFITTKLARHFVSDDPPRVLVDRCARTFTRTDGDIRRTLECVITSPEFFSRAAYRAKVKTPFELVVSTLRAVNAQPDTTPRTAQIIARLGQPIFGRQTPDGWPDRGDAWMNTGAIMNRINFGLSVAAGQLPGAKLTNLPDFAALRSQPREQQVDAVIKAMLGGQVSTVTRDVLMSGNNPMLSAAGSGSTKPNNPTSVKPPVGGMANDAMEDAAPLPPVRAINLKGLPQVIGLALGAPEFQRR